MEREEAVMVPTKHLAAARSMLERFGLLAFALLVVAMLSGALTCLSAAYASQEGESGDAAVEAGPSQDGMSEASPGVPSTPVADEGSVIVEEPVPPATAAKVPESETAGDALASGAVPQSLAPYNVYVYMRIVDSDGVPLTKQQLVDLGLDVKVNGSGWMTMGYLPDVPVGSPPWIGEYGTPEQLEVALSYLPALVPLIDANGNPVNGQVDPFAEGTYWDMTGANGANDYVPAGTLTWHMSGAIPMDMLRDYEVNSVNAVTLDEIAPPEVVPASIGEQVPIADVAVAQFEGYHPVAAGPGTLTVGPYESKNHFVFFYQPEQATIAFEANGGSEVEPLVGVTDEAIPDTAMPVPVRPGYELKGWYADEQLAGDPVEALPDAFPPGTTVYYADWAPSSGDDVAQAPTAPVPPADATGTTGGSVDVAAPIGASSEATAQVANLDAMAGLAQTGDREAQALAALLAIAAGCMALLAAFALRRRAHDEQGPSA